jgi:hypothetical protein
MAVGIEHFNESYPVVPDLGDCLGSATIEKKFWGAYSPKLLKRAWDNSVVYLGNESRHSDPDIFCSFCRFRRIPVSQVRSQKVLSSYIGEYAELTINKEGKQGSRFKSRWQYANRQWHQIGIRDYFVDQHEPPDHTQFKFGLHLQMHQFADHFWHVSLGYEGMPMLKLDTDPQGARAVFRLRDIPEGRQRRTALKHWVTEHWRSTPATNDKSIKVGEYLRGAEKFTWNGLRCIVTPSLADLHRAYPDRFGEPEPLPDFTTPPRILSGEEIASKAALELH